jgi:protein-S-isoprenylcysteine O-methyltransferase Ste14
VTMGETLIRCGGDPAFCRPLRYPRLDRRRAVLVGLRLGDRHPIYTGLILAMLGSAIGVNVLWALPLVLAGAYFVYSARREESVMLQLFPEQYAAYMARTGMLAPCPLRRP